MLEDHEFLVDYLQSWSPDSTNNLVYKERRDKYDILLRPEVYYQPSIFTINFLYLLLTYYIYY